MVSRALQTQTHGTQAPQAPQAPQSPYSFSLLAHTGNVSTHSGNVSFRWVAIACEHW